jgi:trigger factor
LLTANKEISEEVFEKEFPNKKKNMKWELIANHIVKQNDLKVEEQEIIDHAKAVTRRQLSMYGVKNISDEDLTGYAMNYLKDEKSVRGTASQILESKIAELVLSKINVDIQEISLNDFNSMVSKANKGETEEAGEIVEVEEKNEE